MGDLGSIHAPAIRIWSLGLQFRPLLRLRALALRLPPPSPPRLLLLQLPFQLRLLLPLRLPLKPRPRRREDLRCPLKPRPRRCELPPRRREVRRRGYFPAVLSSSRFRILFCSASVAVAHSWR